MMIHAMIPIPSMVSSNLWLGTPPVCGVCLGYTRVIVRIRTRVYPG